MQLITFISAASTMVAGASAIGAATLNSECNTNKPYARIINRCDYDVNLWSVFKGDGCPTDQMVTLKTGEIYNENLQEPTGGSTGISIKISKEEQCKGTDIVQLEYFLEQTNPGFNYNYLDVSYVDCTSDDCPTKQEGYYLISGSQTGATKASAGNTWCPVMSCDDPVSCAKISYILPDDVQTKTCDPDQNIDFYMCGGEAPSGDDESAPESSAEPATSTSEQAEYSTPASSSTEEAYTEEAYTADVKAAAVTPAPEVSKAAENNEKLTQTKVVYVTAYEYVNAKRHAHGHARRHQPFHA